MKTRKTIIEPFKIKVVEPLVMKKQGGAGTHLKRSALQFIFNEGGRRHL